MGYLFLNMIFFSARIMQKLLNYRIFKLILNIPRYGPTLHNNLQHVINVGIFCIYEFFSYCIIHSALCNCTVHIQFSRFSRCTCQMKLENAGKDFMLVPPRASTLTDNTRSISGLRREKLPFFSFHPAVEVFLIASGKKEQAASDWFSHGARAFETGVHRFSHTTRELVSEGACQSFRPVLGILLTVVQVARAYSVYRKKN